jgi:hypothetical protein
VAEQTTNLEVKRTMLDIVASTKEWQSERKLGKEPFNDPGWP